VFSSGDYALLGMQALTVLAVGGYAFAVTYGLGALLHRAVGNRVPPEAERRGLDLSQHGENAYGTDDPEPVRTPRRHRSAENGAVPR
jgi:Amt family ammonium transporter